MRKGLWLAMVLLFLLAAVPSVEIPDTATEATVTGTTTTAATTSATTTAATTTTTAAEAGDSIFASYPAIGWATESLIVRDAASADGTYIGGLAKGSDVTVYGKEGGWYRILYNSGEIGWTKNAYVNADYIVATAPSTSRTTAAKTTATSKGSTTTASPKATAGVSGDRGVATGSFVWPVPGWKKIVQGYGSYHHAIDVYDNAMLGTPILAVDGGTVIMAKSSGYNNGAGTYIQIDHGNGYKSHYCHCSQILFAKGDKVAKGEVIGYVGQTGNTTGPGLHLEMWKNDVYINPLSVLPY